MDTPPFCRPPPSVKTSAPPSTSVPRNARPPPPVVASVFPPPSSSSSRTIHTIPAALAPHRHVGRIRRTAPRERAGRHARGETGACPYPNLRPYGMLTAPVGRI